MRGLLDPLARPPYASSEGLPGGFLVWLGVPSESPAGAGRPACVERIDDCT